MSTRRTYELYIHFYEHISFLFISELIYDVAFYPLWHIIWLPFSGRVAASDQINIVKAGSWSVSGFFQAGSGSGSWLKQSARQLFSLRSKLDTDPYNTCSRIRITMQLSGHDPDCYKIQIQIWIPIDFKARSGFLSNSVPWPGLNSNLKCLMDPNFRANSEPNWDHYQFQLSNPIEFNSVLPLNSTQCSH